MYCRGCGKEIHDNAVICVHCGEATGVPTNPNSESKNVNDLMTGGLIALCILIPLAGIIVGFVRKSFGAIDSGDKCIKYSIIAWIAEAIIYGVIWGVWISRIM